MKHVMTVPLGYASGRSGCGYSDIPIHKRELIWSFAGSVDRPGRSEAL